jgi:hypothetical protein
MMSKPTAFDIFGVIVFGFFTVALVLCGIGFMATVTTRNLETERWSPLIEWAQGEGLAEYRLNQKTGKVEFVDHFSRLQDYKAPKVIEDMPGVIDNSRPEVTSGVDECDEKSQESS